jgi:hypothetical protein
MSEKIYGWLLRLYNFFVIEPAMKKDFSRGYDFGWIWWPTWRFPSRGNTTISSRSSSALLPTSA